jgi:hypothetical protein
MHVVFSSSYALETLGGRHTNDDFSVCYRFFKID